MSDVFIRPIHIYSYGGEEPITITPAEPLPPDQQHLNVEPLRLSYHRGGHYNSVVRIEDVIQEQQEIVIRHYPLDEALIDLIDEVSAVAAAEEEEEAQSPITEE